MVSSLLLTGRVRPFSSRLECFHQVAVTHSIRNLYCPAETNELMETAAASMATEISKENEEGHGKFSSQ